MTDAYDPYKKPEDLGKDSPASGEAKRQSISGARGGPRQSRPRGVPKQPAQTSGRRSARHEQAPTARKSFSPEEDPSEQGTGEPSAQQIKEQPDQQGIAPRSGSHAPHDERTAEREHEGEREWPDPHEDEGQTP